MLDTSLLHAINDAAARHDGLGDAAELYGRASEPLFAALVGGLLVVGAWRERARWALWAALLAGGAAAFAVGVAAVLARVVDRPRPFVAAPGRVHLLVTHARDPGFPSDHATAAFAIAVALVFVHRRLGIVALIAAAMLAIDRVAIGVHYPSDVLAGAALGTAAAVAVALLARRWVGSARCPVRLRAWSSSQTSGLS